MNKPCCPEKTSASRQVSALADEAASRQVTALADEALPPLPPVRPAGKMTADGYQPEKPATTLAKRSSE